MEAKKWSASNVINIENLNLPYAVIILNRKILLKATKFLKLWNNGKCDSLLRLILSTIFLLKFFFIRSIDTSCSGWRRKSLDQLCDQQLFE